VILYVLWMTFRSQDKDISKSGKLATPSIFFGNQDALRKLRLADGTRWPGAWAEVNVCVEEEWGAVVLTSQEKWDHIKIICEHWRSLLERGETNLDFKHLRSDCGFMVYMTQAYPGMKPYLKVFISPWTRGEEDATARA
jgi:hypothetical protein